MHMNIFKHRNFVLILFLGLSFVLLISLVENNSDSLDLENNQIRLDYLSTAGISYDIEINDLDPSKDWVWAVTQSWCSGSGIQNDPYIIENQIFRYQSGSGNGLLIQYSNQYFIIRNCTFTNSTYGSSFPYNGGLKLNDVNNGIIENNEFVSNNGRGIVLYNSDYNRIAHNVIRNNYHGIAIASRCDHNIISNNLIENNTQHGLRFETTLAYENNYNNITSNKIFTNNGHGIYLAGRNDYNHIIDNDIINSNSLGIGIMSMSDNNTSYNNFLVGNNNNGADYGEDNMWNSSSIGNFWDDYSGTDGNDDGIGDTPFHLSGITDFLPIVDTMAPNITINNPLENEEFNNIAPSFNVTITDKYPNFMWYTLNNENTKHYFDSNNSISQNAWNALPGGSIIIKFYANDRALNEAFQEVIVIKLTEAISFGLIPIISSILIGIAIILSKTVYKRKKITK